KLQYDNKNELCTELICAQLQPGGGSERKTKQSEPENHGSEVPRGGHGGDDDARPSRSQTGQGAVSLAGKAEGPGRKRRSGGASDGRLHATQHQKDPQLAEPEGSPGFASVHRHSENRDAEPQPANGRKNEAGRGIE